jgi:hypothetical protein
VIETSRVGEPDLRDLLPLVRAYCDFYEVAPTDDTLLALSRALIEDPEREGVQLIARDNKRAQAVYERIGATRDEWVDYWLAVSPGSS